METITIPKEEYERLKKTKNVDMDLVNQFLQSFRDIKAGKVRRVK